MRAFPLCCIVLAAAHTASAQPHADADRPVPILDVPFVSQSELLCGGAAAAMVLRYWGERDVSADAFAHLVDHSAAGIRTDALVADLRQRGWDAREIDGDDATVRRVLADARPVLVLIEDRPSTFHYVVVVAWHERGIVFHDPARGPFRVMSVGEFTRRWRAARRWAAVVDRRPGTGDRRSGLWDPGHREEGSDPRSLSPDLRCDERVADGVRLAQQRQLDEAEQVLAGAISCSGATRELAGLRVLQRRWPEAADLASAAVAADRTDAYAWKVLATSRFVQDDPLGALEAWNAIGEPRIDLVRIDGLSRTRHPVVERLLDAPTGAVLTTARFTRAQRRLTDLPAAASSRLDYVPVPSGLAELRGAVDERPLVPGGTTLVITALAAAVTREVRLTSGPVFGGGEQWSFGYRFWPHRRRVSGGIQAPSPWGGLWRLDAVSEQQPFTASVPRAERTGVQLALSDWATGHLRWTLGAGIDEWDQAPPRGVVAGRLRWASLDDRIDTVAGLRVWPGSRGFTTTSVGARVRSSVDVGPRQTPNAPAVVVATATAHVASAFTPLDLWPAGDTGHARATLLRAHPLLDEGSFRIDRLGRSLVQASIEARRWWTATGRIRAAAAAFTDVGRTSRRWRGTALIDVDAGLGGRLAIGAMPGVFRLDVAKGLRDGATTMSIGYEPWDLTLE